MSDVAKLDAKVRESRGKGAARKMRATGRVPAVVYGPDGTSQSLSVDAHEALSLFGTISVENTIVSLDIEGEGGAVDTLVREVQMHPFKPNLLHLDFYKVTKGVVLQVQVPLHFEGTPAGVRLSSGILEQHVHDIEVSCVPSKIPEYLEVEVTDLELGDSLHVRDVSVPEGVEVVTELDRTLCTVVLPRGAVSDEAEAEELEGDEVEGAEGETPAEATEEA